MYRNPGWWISIPWALACVSAAGAETDFSDAFQSDHYEMALMSGTMFSPVGADQHRSTEDYTLSGVQFGWMLSDPGEPGWWRGNWEVSLEAMGGKVFEGKGSYVVGGTVWMRYNFIQPNWRVVPYFQAGAGAEATDMDRILIGQTFNFNLDVSAGAKCLVAKHWAVELELRYQHLSNARLSKHDVGINAVGPLLGVSYFF
jgi:opacity protein-like surface antigen